MDTENLLDGIAVVIDDEIEVKGANINSLIDQIKKRRMPYLAYQDLPEPDVIRHLGSISFLLLDWKLQAIDSSTLVTDGVTIPDTIEEYAIKENIDFLIKLNESWVIPIFIFTNENTEKIINVLEENGLYERGKLNNIFVRSKSELTGRTKLFKTLENWIEKNLSIFVLKEWELKYQKAKSRLFNDFYSLSPNWPRILWKNFKKDGVNMSQELGEVISKNLHSRMTPFVFDDTILSKIKKNPEKDEIRRVLEGERYLKRSQLHKDHIGTGDIFKENYEDNGETRYRYYLNIRAQCDLVRSSNPELYCLKGRLLDETLINKKNGSIFKNGHFIEKINQAIVTSIDDGKIIEFLFNDLKIKKWNGLKTKRIGRLLPPYIINIQQRYALYIKRQGLPRTPEIAV
jgi:hypothetical protein